MADVQIARRARRRRRSLSARQSARLAIGVLVLLPVLLYVPAAIAGRVFLPGDELTQNYPLRVLVGRLIAQGHLPTWDPFIWSGTPLLAGWNAGAMFPLTLLFAVLPAVGAWTINVVAAPVICGLGTYFFLRRQRCRPIPSLLAALVFTYTGFMSGQVVHIGLELGTAFIPWCMLALDDIARARSARGRLFGIALFGSCFALIVLAGDPRAVTSAAIMSGIYALALLWRHRRRALWTLACTIAGGVLAVGLSAIQWLPGIRFLHASQRGSTAYNFFGAGSFGAPHLVVMMVTPFLFGGNANFGLPVYSGTYNLPEITVGVGYVALIAALSYLPGMISSGLDRLRKRSGPRTRRPLLVFYVLVLVGIVLSLGVSVPTGRLLVHVPLYGLERLQNRNAVIFDFALAVLVGYFVDDLWRGGFRRRSRASGRGPLESRLSRLLCLLPLCATVGIVAVSLLAPVHVQNLFHDTTVIPGLFDEMLPYLIATVLLCALVTAFGLFAPHLRRTPRVLVAVALVVFDVTMFLANASYATESTAALSPKTTASSELVKDLGNFGRFAIFDPNMLLSSSATTTLDELGVTDLNILRSEASVQGYGSIVNGEYQNETNTHTFEGLYQAQLANGSFDVLNLTTLLTLPVYLYHAINPTGPLPAPNSPVTNPPGSEDSSVVLAPGASRTFVLGPAQTLRRVTLVLNVAKTSSIGPLVLRAQDPGREPVRQQTTLVGDEARSSFGQGVRAESIKVTNPTARSVTITEVVGVIGARSQSRVLLDGVLQGDLSPNHWHYAGTLGPFWRFSNEEARGPAWLEPVAATSPADRQRVPGSVRVTSHSSTGAEQLVVTTSSPAKLVRSEGYAPDWTVKVTSLATHKTTVAEMSRFGLVQAVDLPKGRFRVAISYQPSSVGVGWPLSLASLIVLAGVVVSAALTSEKKKSSMSPTGTSVVI